MESAFHELNLFLVSVSRHIHNGILDAVRVGDFVKQKSLLFAGWLNEDIAIVQNRGEKPFDFARRVLNTEEKYFAHMADEESSLLDIHDAFVGNDPHVEIVVDPNEESEEPQEDKKRVFDEEEEGAINAAQKLGISKSKRDEYADNGNKSEKEWQELDENIEPVSVNNEEDFFVVILPFKGVSLIERSIWNHHRGNFQWPTNQFPKNIGIQTQ